MLSDIEKKKISKTIDEAKERLKKAKVEKINSNTQKAKMKREKNT